MYKELWLTITNVRMDNHKFPTSLDSLWVDTAHELQWSIGQVLNGSLCVWRFYYVSYPWDYRHYFCIIIRPFACLSVAKRVRSITLKLMKFGTSNYVPRLKPNRYQACQDFVCIQDLKCAGDRSDIFWRLQSDKISHFCQNRLEVRMCLR